MLEGRGRSYREVRTEASPSGFKSPSTMKCSCWNNIELANMCTLQSPRSYTKKNLRKRSPFKLGAKISGMPCALGSSRP